MHQRGYKFPNIDVETVYEVRAIEDENGKITGLTENVEIDYEEVMKEEVEIGILKMDEVHKELVQWNKEEYSCKLKWNCDY